MEEHNYTDEELINLFKKLFPNGYNDLSIINEIAPLGWNKSPLLKAFHPTVEQSYKDYCQLTLNLRSFDKKKADHDSLISFEAYRDDYKETSIDEAEEVENLVGMCIWDIFSNNHTVLDTEGRSVDLGSHRTAGSFIASMLELKSKIENISLFDCDYLRFYLGTSMIFTRTDYRPVYKMIFIRLKSQNLDWEYFFPRIFLHDLSNLKGQQDSDINFSPVESFQKELENKKRKEETQKFKDALDEAHQECIEKSKQLPPPSIVMAYYDVYDSFPKGWPPSKV